MENLQTASLVLLPLALSRRTGSRHWLCEGEKADDPDEQCRPGWRGAAADYYRCFDTSASNSENCRWDEGGGTILIFFSDFLLKIWGQEFKADKKAACRYLGGTAPFELLLLKITSSNRFLLVQLIPSSSLMDSFSVWLVLYWKETQKEWIQNQFVCTVWSIDTRAGNTTGFNLQKHGKEKFSLS